MQSLTPAQRSNIGYVQRESEREARGAAERSVKCKRCEALVGHARHKAQGARRGGRQVNVHPAGRTLGREHYSFFYQDGSRDACHI
jgi:hypothetical protein